jgi:hypothetical protein
MQKPRTRLLSLRMTQDEYLRLRDTAAEQGARSVSEFARTAVLTALSPASFATRVGSQAFDELVDRIGRLEQDLANVKGRFL